MKSIQKENILTFRVNDKAHGFQFIGEQSQPICAIDKELFLSIFIFCCQLKSFTQKAVQLDLFVEFRWNGNIRLVIDVDLWWIVQGVDEWEDGVFERFYWRRRKTGES